MCGIYGVYRLDGESVPPAWLERMGRVLIHRGPDDDGTYSDGNCAIGMRRLSIIDLEGGHQPISNHDNSLVVVCNGEIYNFRELRNELLNRGHRFKTRSDSEVVLHAYAEWGDAFVERMNGMFAFAIWDSRTRTLLVGRDRLGVKPLYYSNDGKRIAFASEAKALFELPGQSVEIDRAALLAYLELGYVPSPLCIANGVKKLPTGSMLKVTTQGTQMLRFWRPRLIVDRGVSSADWAGRIRNQLEESVRSQMVSDVPIGAFLSGGIDSSAVLAFMSRHSNAPVKTYSIGFDGGAAEQFYNELDDARTIARHFRTDHHEILVRPDVVKLLPKLLWHMDEPIADSAFLTTYLVAEFARQDVKVILSGMGGDELFGGYRRYLGEHYLRYFERLPASIRRGAGWLASHLPADRHSRLLNYSRLAKSFLASTHLPFAERYRSYVGVFPVADAAALVSGPTPLRHDVIAALFDETEGADPLARMFAVDAQTQLPDDLLMLTDKMTMATSLECRVPLLDNELLELASRIPASVKLAGGELKALMKQALADVLPHEVLQRRKRGFGAPLGAWLKGPLLDLLNSALSRQSVEARGLLRYGPVKQLIDDHRASRLDGTDRLLALLNLEVWCRVYLDKRSSDDVADELKEAVA